ncbi:MAG: hypothetical protein OIN88_08195 [Candidatus Methanoperedens sp.]|nr:hypothetical protein [Candidatus Methanoperedens sp.]
MGMMINELVRVLFVAVIVVVGVAIMFASATLNKQLDEKAVFGVIGLMVTAIGFMFLYLNKSIIIS